MKTKVTEKEKEDFRSERQAAAQFDSIKDMVEALKDAEKADNDKAREDAEQTIHEDPLSVEVRSLWYDPCAKDADKAPGEFTILLCTGGPAVRIIGDLDQYGQPERARIEHQDWGTPWTEYRINAEDEEVLLTYCQQFYFGE